MGTSWYLESGYGVMVEGIAEDVTLPEGYEAMEMGSSNYGGDEHVAVVLSAEHLRQSDDVMRDNAAPLVFLDGEEPPIFDLEALTALGIRPLGPVGWIVGVLVC